MTSVPPAGLPGTNFERTFIAIKPDGVQRGKIGAIISRFEDKGVKVVELAHSLATLVNLQGTSWLP